MKIKTSLSLEEEVLAKAKALAKADARSTSNFLERVIEHFVASHPEADALLKKAYPAPTNRLSLAGVM